MLRNELIKIGQLVSQLLELNSVNLKLYSFQNFMVGLFLQKEILFAKALFFAPDHHFCYVRVFNLNYGVLYGVNFHILPFGYLTILLIFLTIFFLLNDALSLVIPHKMMKMILLHLFPSIPLKILYADDHFFCPFLPFCIHCQNCFLSPFLFCLFFLYSLWDSNVLHSFIFEFIYPSINVF